MDEAGKKRETWADGLGRMIEADEPDSSNNLTQATCYLYDANNNLRQVVAPNGATRTFSYDALSRLTSAATPEGGNVSYSYDGNGNVLSRVAPKENQTSPSVTVTTTYSYDALNRLTEKSYNDSTTPAAYFVYDQSSAWGGTVTNPVGRLTTTQTIPPGSSTVQTATLFEYDPMGRVTVSEECQPQSCATAPNLAAQYVYDLLGDATSLQQQDYSGAFNFTLSYAYNGIGQLSGITSSWSDSTHPATLLSGAAYSAAGKPAGDTLGNSLTETFGYNSRLWPSSATTGSVYSLSLGYAANGSVTTANDSVNGNSTLTYDNVNRLATMSAPSSPTGCYGLSWTYDSVGNRTAQSVTSGTCPTSSLGFNTNNQITSPSGYHYDAAGNMTNDTVHGYTYDAEGRILTVDGGTGAYVYDAFGRRIEKTTGSTSVIYLYDLSGHEIAVVSAAGGNLQDDIYVGSRHLAMYTNATTSFFHADQVGAERARTTVTGTVDSTCTSLPFGDSQSCTGGEPLGRFAGYERDNEYGLGHAPVRYYSPALGRFMTPDPLSEAVPKAGAAAWADFGSDAHIATLFGNRLDAVSSMAQAEPGQAAPWVGAGYMSGGSWPTGEAAIATQAAIADPQGWDAYAYVTNTPSSLVDASGKWWLCEAINTAAVVFGAASLLTGDVFLGALSVSAGLHGLACAYFPR
ncbi:MAG TPA: RHS repeat-associated core domain-containing protein [Candidatus Acidoferrales bacterium]|nr:RHS repeat-associated core domain-containing protein [Candidatus Acidoferrales bacterium]